MALLASAASAFACDAGSRANEDDRRAAIRIVDANVGPDRPLPADGAIQVAFDRYLLPSTVTRQAVTVVTAEGEPLPTSRVPVVTYDPVARTVTLVPTRPDWLDVGTLYRLALSIPEGDTDAFGLRAIDRATLDPAQDRVIEFLVTEPTGRPYDEGRVAFCRDVLPIFVARCDGGQCHGAGGGAAAGLELTTAEGLTRTALGQVARAATTSGRSASPEAEGRVFGVNMARVAPGSPGASWLLYKTELAALSPPRTTPSCPSASSPGAAPPWVPLTAPRVEAGAEERAALGGYVQGAPMPYPVLGPAGPHTEGLDLTEREILRRWIAQLVPGEPLPACEACSAP